MDYSAFRDIVFDRRENGILWMTLSRPSKLNVADAGLHQAFGDIWPVIDRDPTVRVAVITGEGRAFSAGGDLDRVKNAHGNFDEVVAILEETRDIVYNMLRCSKPIISAVNGVAVGAGVVVALLSDISIMAENARLADGHTRMGWAAGDHSAIIWPLLCGMAKAKYYLITSDFIDGREAERIGLVSLCVPADQVLPKALEVGDRLARGAQQAIRWTKRSLNNWLRQAGPIFDQSIALEMLTFMDEDVREGIKAIREKRPPRFPSAR